MSTSTPQEEPEQHTDRATKKQERNAMVFSIIAVVVIFLLASPCICYFGAGLFQGVHTLRTGNSTNPARQGYQKQGVDWRGQYKRPERYNRKFDKPAKESPKSE